VKAHSSSLNEILLYYVKIDCIAETIKGNKPDLPAPGESEASMQRYRQQYATKFTYRIIRAMNGKS
jgi:hypothetical protein